MMPAASSGSIAMNASKMPLIVRHTASIPDTPGLTGAGGGVGACTGGAALAFMAPRPRARRARRAAARGLR